MNISQLLRGITGSTQPVDAKALELKIGQVVKGIVLQILAEHDALVNIGGTPIRARLETPLQVGQMTLLQVQPESSSGQVVLKPLGSSNVQILETSLVDLVKSFGMKDTEANRALIQQLHAAAIPLNAKTIKSFQPTGNMAPAPNVPLDQWTEAAIVAHKKGLPLKSEIVLPLQQAMFSKPLPQSLEQLEASLQKFIQAAPPQEGDTDTLALVRKLIQTISSLSTGKLTNPTALIPAEQSGRTTEATGRMTQPDIPRTLPSESIIISAKQGTTAPAPVNTQQAATPQSTSAAIPASTSTGTPVLTVPSSPTTPTAPMPVQAITTPTATIIGTSTVGPSIVPPTDTETFQTSQNTATNQGVPRASTDLAAPQRTQTNEQLQQSTAQQAIEHEDGPWIKNLLKQLGVDYEHRSANVLTQLTDLPDLEDLQFRHESVKGLLLQLASTEDMPSALKESIQQVVQQITGQQLLLGAERGNPFSLVTMFVPIQHENGTDTASVHIQSKRKQGGTLDPDNCRLLFDLRMSTLGDTLVDVQVVDRIVSLQVHNDFPLIGNLLESLKPEIEAAMKQIGFQFISMRHMPYPDQTAQQSSDAATTTDTRSSVSTTYHSKPYKGVDLRV